MLHYIQKKIIKRLLEKKEARYSELKDEKIEGNLFSYHLKGLLRKGYIIHKKELYSLSSEGKHLVSRLSLENLDERIQPVIVTTIIIQKKDGEYLLYRRKKEPFFDHVCFPYGKIHLDEPIEEAAERELREKTGYTTKLNHRGDVYMTVHDKNELISQTLHHIFTGSKLKEEIIKECPGGECFWGSLDEVDKKYILPGVKNILELVKKNKNKHFFKQLFLDAAE